MQHSNFSSIEVVFETTDQPLRGIVCGLEGNDAWVRFDQERSARWLSLGFEGTAVVKPSAGLHAFEAKALIVDQHKLDEARWRVSFGDERFVRLVTQIGDALNRRSAYRVTLDPNSRPVSVTMSLGPSGVQRGLLTNISATGLGVMVSPPQLDVARGDRLELRFDLPGNLAPSVFEAWVRTLHEEPEGVRYGIEFDPKRTVGFDWQEEAVLTWLMREQRAALRAERRVVERA